MVNINLSMCKILKQVVLSCIIENILRFQVSKMLLGGMNVVGLYVWAAESSYKTSSTLLWQVILFFYFSPNEF